MWGRKSCDKGIGLWQWINHFFAEFDLSLDLRKKFALKID